MYPQFSPAFTQQRLGVSRLFLYHSKVLLFPYMILVLDCRNTSAKIHILDLSGGTIFPYFRRGEAAAAAVPGWPGG
jgi:hypothetical protein